MAIRLAKDGWLYEACSTASEWPFDGRADYWPDTINANGGLFPVNGLLRARTSRVQPGGAQAIATTHGYAAGLFLHYIFNNGAMDYSFFGRLWRGLGQWLHGFEVPQRRLRLLPGQLLERLYPRRCYSGQLRNWNEDNIVLDPLVLAATVGSIPDAYFKCKDFDDALGGKTFAIIIPPHECRRPRRVP